MLPQLLKLDTLEKLGTLDTLSSRRRRDFAPRSLSLRDRFDFFDSFFRLLLLLLFLLFLLLCLRLCL